MVCSASCWPQRINFAIESQQRWKKKNSDVAAGMAQQECSDSKYYVSAFKYI